MSQIVNFIDILTFFENLEIYGKVFRIRNSMKIVNEQLKENMWRKRLKLKSQAKKQEKIKATPRFIFNFLGVQYFYLYLVFRAFGSV